MSPNPTPAEDELAFHVANTPLAVIEWDAAFRVVRWTGQAPAVFGWAADEVLGKTPAEWEFVFAEDVPRINDTMRGLLAGGDPRSVVENRNYTKTGAVIWCEWHNSARYAGGRMLSCLSLVLDVTARRAAQDALARSEERLRAALASAKMLGWDWDIAAKRATFSGDFAAFYGLPHGPDYGELANTWAAIHPDDIEGVTAARQAALASGELAYEFRGRVPCPDGRVRWFATRGQILRAADGTPRRVVAVTADVTDRKRAEAEREEMTRQLIDAQKWESLGVLAGGVAHDFNNILTVVLGSAGLARKTLPPNSPARGHLDQIETASRKAADLCRQMLAYSGRGPAAAAGQTDLNRLIRESAALLGVTASKNVGILFELQPDLPEVRADAAQVRQVLVNLVMNAAEALGDQAGEVRVRTATVDVYGAEPDAGYRLPPSPGRYARLSVTDDGPGMPADVKARMFDPFFSTRFAGRGLGLAAVLGFVRAHGGAIRVETEPGRGTTVEVLWRVGPAAEAEQPAGRRGAAAGHALVVDDEMYIREVAASTVEELGYEPLLAADGPAGVELFRHHRRTVRVAVIDWMMPGMNGDQVRDALRAIDPELPVVVISGFTDRRHVQTDARTEFVQKPFLPEELAAAARRVLGLPAV